MKKLVVSDLSNIEGRILAWLAGESWKLDAFRAYDAGTGPDLYNVTAVSIIGGDPYDVAKKDRNAFGKVPDLACVAGDTLVLTPNGYKGITEVTLADKVWDGTSWVTHSGVVDRKIRQTINVDGMRVTPDHLIKTGKTWSPAGLLAIRGSMLSQALATCSGNLPYWASISGTLVGCKASKCNALVAHRHITCRRPTYDSESPPAAMPAPRKHLDTTPNTSGVTQMSCPMKRTVGDYLIESLRALIGAATPMTRRGRTMVGAEYECTRRGSLIEKNTCATWCRWMAGINPIWSWTASIVTATMRQVTYVLSPRPKTPRISEASLPCSPESPSLRHASPSLRHVYDIKNAGPRNRFMVKTNSGHMLVHNCGYQGGAAAIQTFAKAYGVKMADHWGTIRAKADASYVIKAQENLLTGWGRDSQRRLEIDDLEWVASETVKLAWRGRHPATRQLWYDVESAAKSAIQQPGVVFQAGQHLSYMSVARMGQKWLLGKLPSGKYLTYFNPRLTQDGGICYDGNGSEEPGKPSIWCTLYTHGGKLVGNACQATAGDILKSTMPAIEAAGYGVVLTVHDEAVTEAPDEPRYSAKHLSELLATNPPWAPGLPLAAAGFEAYRYCKED